MAVVVLVGVGALAFGLGLGAGAHLNAIDTLGVTRAAKEIRLRAPVSAMSAQEARDRFRCNSVSEYYAVPTNEELEEMLAWRQARYAEPKWGAP